MRGLLVTLGTLLNVAQLVPYWVEMFRGKAKPNIVTWLTWALLTGISGAAAFWHSDWQAGWVITANVVGTASVVVLGLRLGYAKMTRLDAICQAIALLGLLSWPFLHDPTLAVVTVVVVDIMAWIPTLHHSYKKPAEEVWQTYALSGVASALGLLALTQFTIVSALYLSYLVLADIILVMVILQRRRQLYRAA